MSWRTRAVKTRAGLWRLSSAVGVITPDDSGFGNHGTMVNAPTFARTPWGVGCMEFNGNNQYVNLEDLGYLNAVSAFTIAFWMNQDVLDQIDYIFIKTTGANEEIRIATWDNGFFYVYISAGAQRRASFDYSAVISASTWHHVALVYDGGQAVNANRLILYVDGGAVTWASIDAIPTATFDLAGGDATVGRNVGTFDGKLFDLQIHNVPLTRDEINDLMRGR